MIPSLGLRSHHFSFWRVILNNYNIIFSLGFSLKSEIVHFSDWEIDFLNSRKSTLNPVKEHLFMMIQSNVDSF